MTSPNNPAEEIAKGLTEADERDPYWDYDDEECSNCGGEGFTYGCSWNWQCDTWDGDSCLCTRRCEWCQPSNPDPALQAVLATALLERERTGK